MKSHDYAIDLMKFVAVLMITNSHFLPLYQDVKPSLATFGVHGNALFFFITGFTLALSGSTMVESFYNWYKRRLRRIWPSLIVWASLSSIICGSEISWKTMFLGYGYWFLQFILAAYIVMYFVLRYAKNYLKHLVILSTIGTSIAIIFLPHTPQSIYHEYHYFCYISCIVLGAYCATNKREIVVRGGVKCIISFILYFLIMSLGKGKEGLLYYTQIFALLPLLSFIYYAYYTCSSAMDTVCKHKSIYNVVYWIGSLCLEVYVVQHIVITDKWNSIFPLNILIVFTLIILLAYALHILTNFFIQTIYNNPYEWKKIMKI